MIFVFDEDNCFSKNQDVMKVVGKKHYKQYTLKDILGAGAFGKVYYSPPYAIKEMNFAGMSPFLANALKNEISILNKINHPNVVKLVDFFYEGSSVYLVMQYCQLDLDKFLRKNKITEKTALSIFSQLLTGFRELVNQGIIHRDLKPANILVNSKNQFKLADFGLSKFVDHYDSKLLRTVVGTPLYMSPQILNRTEYTTKSDIWSLGIILYEMITGTHPWAGNSESDLCKNVNKIPLTIPKNVSAFSRDLLTRMLQKNEKQRIGWEQLFALVLIPNNISPQKQRPQTSRQAKQNKQNPQKSPSRRKLFSNNQQKVKSNKKIDPQGKENIINMEKENRQKQKQRQKQRQRERQRERQRQRSRQRQKQKQACKIAISEQVIRQIFIIEMQRILGEQEAKKLTSKNYNSMSIKQQQNFQKALLNFNEQFQLAVRTIFRGGFK